MNEFLMIHEFRKDDCIRLAAVLVRTLKEMSLHNRITTRGMHEQYISSQSSLKGIKRRYSYAHKATYATV